jgi:hypothetical protein
MFVRGEETNPPRETQDGHSRATDLHVDGPDDEVPAPHVPTNTNEVGMLIATAIQDLYTLHDNMRQDALDKAYNDNTMQHTLQRILVEQCQSIKRSIDRLHGTVDNRMVAVEKPLQGMTSGLFSYIQKMEAGGWGSARKVDKCVGTRSDDAWRSTF